MVNPIAATTGGYPGSSLERVLTGLSRAGFRSVELFAIPGDPRVPVERMSRDDVEELRRRLDGHGLAPVSVSAHSDLATDEGVKSFTARLAFARSLGVAVVNTGTTHGDSKAEAERFFDRMRREIVPCARENGVCIALETHGGLTGTAADCLRTLDRIASEQVGINYDTANVIYYRGVRPEEDVKLVARRVIHVHLKDKRGGRLVEDFPPLGQGTIDFAAVVAVLREAGYRGPFSAEVELRAPSADEEDRLLRGTREFMENLLGEGGRS